MRHRCWGRRGGWALAALASAAVALWAVSIAPRPTPADPLGGLARQLLFEVYDSLGEVPGSRQARTAIVDAAQVWLDGLDAGLDRDPRAPFDQRLQAASGHRRLAELLGAPGDSLGRPDAARQHAVRAQQLLGALRDTQPRRDDIALELGELRVLQSALALLPPADVGAARAAATDALRLFRDQLHKHGSQRRAGLGVLAAQLALAEAQAAAGDTSGALAAVEAALRGLREGFGVQPQLREATQMAGRAQQLAGALHYRLGQREDAVQRFREATQTYQRLLDAQPGSLRLQRSLALSHWNAGRVLGGLDRPQDALQQLDAALGLSRGLGAQDSEDTAMAVLHGMVQQRRSATLAALQRHDDASAALLDAIGVREAQRDRAPRDAARQQAVVEAYRDMAALQASAGHGQAACDWSALAEDLARRYQRDFATTAPLPEAAGPPDCGLQG